MPTDSEAVTTREIVNSLLKDFEAWCFNLGVFAAPTASLDQTLRYSDEIRGVVTQLLLILRLNLEFIKIHDLPEDSLGSTTSRPEEKGGDTANRLEGTVEEALQAIAAVLQTLDRLGTTIRKSSASSLSSRLKSFSEQENDEEYRSLANNIVAFKYPMAPSSLQLQLVEAMTDRRQRLRYIRQHQQKTTPKDQQGLKAQKNHDLDSSNHGPGPSGHAPKTRAAVLGNQGASQPSDNTHSQDSETTPGTTAWTFRPATSATERVRRDMSKSVISSSGASTTRMIGDLNDYPEPPTHEQWSQDPKCPTCWRQLKESELKGNKWRRHVDTDFEPYVCISEDCRKPLQFFTNLSLWENHMRNKHSTKWAQLVHKPTVWMCDFEHDDEEFRDDESLQEHLRKQHSDLNEAERKAVATSGTRVEARAKHICPLCGYNSTSEQDSSSEPTSSIPQKSEMDQLSELAKHIAGHLRCLAFHTLDHLDSDQENVSEQDTETTSAKARSRSCPHSGLKGLDDISMTFRTDDDPRSVSTFDELRTSQDETISVDEASPQIVSILPEFEEDWEGIMETRPAEEETIFHDMIAYSLWDRAYDSLKRTNPLLVERYEIMLSEELVKDPEGGSKQSINLFRDADIHKRRSLLNTIADKLLEEMRDTFQSNQVTERVTPTLDWIIESSMGNPEACLPRVGFFLSLIFLSNVETRGGGDWRGYIILMSRLLWLSLLELCIRSASMVPTRDRAKVQIRAAVPYGQFYGLQGLLSECKRLDSEFMDQASAAGIYFEMTPVQNGRQWSAATMLELITALGPVDEKVRLWGESFEVDPRNIKEAIEKARGREFIDMPSWVLDHQSFLGLQNDPETRLLWVRGPPATSKTTLLCHMIDHLTAKLKVVPYFFCRATDPNLNSGTAVLRGLLFLLATARPSLIYRYDVLQKQRDGHMSTWESISELFSTILKDTALRGTILVVDALDECLTDRDLPLELIKRPSNVKWIVSSRNSPEIMEELSNANKVTMELVPHLNGVRIVR
ncbi:hypothetical protein CEP54_011990 [Fusarium duplospermum]|uniref:NACHT domain-containing protein n=1 Tax=Fusarium duplospermum TaxID=1325734 RepID=A0A428PBA3_9HYPO|nr:hypothetical protein CEP54_011990 [Fusarium duplospermum]